MIDGHRSFVSFSRLQPKQEGEREAHTHTHCFGALIAGALMISVGVDLQQEVSLTPDCTNASMLGWVALWDVGEVISAIATWGHRSREMWRSSAWWGG